MMVPKLLNKEAPTSSMYSGSEADASQRLFRMKMLGRDRRSLTLWKNCFSWRREKTSVEEGQSQPRPWECRSRWRRGYRLHQRGLRVGHQHEHISVQAKFVNPAVQLCGDVDPRARGDRSKPISGTQTASPKAVMHTYSDDKDQGILAWMIQKWDTWCPLWTS